MSARALFVLFLAVAAALASVGFWLDSWWPFAGAVVAAAVAGLALTSPPPPP